MVATIITLTIFDTDWITPLYHNDSESFSTNNTMQWLYDKVPSVQYLSFSYWWAAVTDKTKKIQTAQQEYRWTSSINMYRHTCLFKVDSPTPASSWWLTWSIYAWTNAIQSVYVWNTQANAVYVWDTKIFPAWSLPLTPARYDIWTIANSWWSWSQSISAAWLKTVIVDFFVNPSWGLTKWSHIQFENWTNILHTSFNSNASSVNYWYWDWVWVNDYWNISDISWLAWDNYPPSWTSVHHIKVITPNWAYQYVNWYYSKTKSSSIANDFFSKDNSSLTINATNNLGDNITNAFILVA
jgi:hypothetical protein